ncbi:unnamed protein product [Pleuronectes platessa]|uniref:Uncharacterized protein n=1 Tax=Pleuronectes platessa TaxID=8262 RepID=A0A9N7Y4V3_PLEPL|nr:unnamed protein product [Pleuronectes platessa]
MSKESPSGRNETICPSAGDCPRIEDGVKLRQRKRAAGFDVRLESPDDQDQSKNNQNRRLPASAEKAGATLDLRSTVVLSRSNCRHSGGILEGAGRGCPSPQNPPRLILHLRLLVMFRHRHSYT